MWQRTTNNTGEMLFCVCVGRSTVWLSLLIAYHTVLHSDSTMTKELQLQGPL
ncbi:hypothetical protein Mapa_002649 [Marchantia paleacea]|nr:hypothetical protein Mapa_002649 [Marchantia paleacea]